MGNETVAIDQADFDEMSMIAEQHTKKEDDVTCSDVIELREARLRIAELELECDEFKAHCAMLIEFIERDRDNSLKYFFESPTDDIINKMESTRVANKIPKQSLLLHDADLIESAIKRAAGNYYKSGDEHYGFTEGWLKSQAEFQANQLRAKAK